LPIAEKFQADFIKILKVDKNMDQRILEANILIVDDEPANIELLRQTLAGEGYENLYVTCDPRKACEIYEKIWPDLLLLDLNMPYMDGFQVLEKLKTVERRSYLPILVLTALTAKETLLRALKSGAKDFLTKPLDLNEVLCRVRNILEVRLLHNEIRNQNNVLETRVRERTIELEKTRLSVIQRLGHAAEWRDNETGNHVIRMSNFSNLLAKKIGLDEKQCELILNASPMHDIGKIGIPDSVLLKPGKLDHDEWKIMQTHVTIGVSILSGDDSSLMQMARKIALEHHEKWDGSGYPHGLKGEEISLDARVVALCDVFDALTSVRPYKKAWSVDESINFIEQSSGSHFEPKLVYAFKETLPEMIKIINQFSD
jgi:putative two-component system response regulator